MKYEAPRQEYKRRYCEGGYTELSVTEKAVRDRVKWRQMICDDPQRDQPKEGEVDLLSKIAQIHNKTEQK